MRPCAIRPRWCEALLVSLLVLAVLAPAASANRDFSVRFAANTQGNITLTGNTLMTCPASLACTTAQGGSGTVNNNSWAMVRFDRDQDPSTSNSSSAQLTLLANAEVLFAALYYGGRDAIESPERSRVKFAARPGSSTCTTPALPATRRSPTVSSTMPSTSPATSACTRGSWTSRRRSKP